MDFERKHSLRRGMLKEARPTPKECMDPWRDNEAAIRVSWAGGDPRGMANQGEGGETEPVKSRHMVRWMLNRRWERGIAVVEVRGQMFMRLTIPNEGHRSPGGQ